MFQTLVRDFGRLAVFMICARMIVLFRPRESYEKYLRLLMSARILLQFLTPVKRILSGEALDLRVLGEYAESMEIPFGENGAESIWEKEAEEESYGTEIDVEVEDVTEIRTKEIYLGGSDEP